MKDTQTERLIRMNEQTVSKFVTGGVALSIGFVMLLGAGYVYACVFLSDSTAKILGIPVGIIIALFLSHHLGKTYAIFKHKQTQQRAEYLLNYPLLLCTLGFFLAVVFIGASGISSEAKTITIATFLLVGLFNLYLSIRLLKQM